VRKIKELIMDRKVKTARDVYVDGFQATKKELKILGFDKTPSKEYLIDTVLRVLADAYVEATK